MVDHHVELGPGAELPLPVGDGGERRDDQERPFDALHVNLVEECDRLDGLSKTHLVSQDTVSPGGGGGLGAGARWTIQINEDDDEDPYYLCKYASQCRSVASCTVCIFAIQTLCFKDH